MNIIAWIVGVIVVLGGGFFLFQNSKTTSVENVMIKDGTGAEGEMMKKEETIMDPSTGGEGTMMKKGDEAMMQKDEGAMMKKGDTMMVKYTGTVLAGKSAPLIDYNKADYDAAIASDKLVVLYFYANWCPICKEEVANALIPAFNELTTDRVVGIRISYKDSDTDSGEKALAAEYGIPYQHTKVFLKNGKQILKAPDSWDKMRYLTEINKALAQ